MHVLIFSQLILVKSFKLTYFLLIHNNFFVKYRFMNRLADISKNIIAQSTSQNQFQYTTDKGCLTLQQRKFYEENGYIVIRNFLKDADIQKWKTRFLEYCDKKTPELPGMVIVRDISLVKKNKGKQLLGQANITKVQNFQFDQILHSFSTNPQIIPYLKSFCGDNIKSMHTMFINKPPGMGGSSRHPFHQDLVYFPFGPANRIVAAWASLQDAFRQNGSLNIIPKSHKGKLYEHEYPDWNGQVNKAYLGIKGYHQVANQRIDLEMKKGDIVFFHPLLVHGSGENKSNGYRKSMCCHFAASQCKYLPFEGTVQQFPAKQTMEAVIQKSKSVIKDFHTLWKMKSQLVCGQDFQDGI